MHTYAMYNCITTNTLWDLQKSAMASAFKTVGFCWQFAVSLFILSMYFCLGAGLCIPQGVAFEFGSPDEAAWVSPHRHAGVRRLLFSNGATDGTSSRSPSKSSSRVDTFQFGCPGMEKKVGLETNAAKQARKKY